MKTELLEALRNNQDFVLAMPCGATLSIPAATLTAWSTTPAPESMIAEARNLMATAGAELQAKPGGPILDIIIQLLPTLLPVLLPILIQSLTPKTNGDVPPAP